MTSAPWWRGTWRCCTRPGGGGRGPRPSAGATTADPAHRAFRRIFGDNFFYILYFQEPGPADAELDADPERTMRLMLAGMRPPADEAAAMRMLAPTIGNGSRPGSSTG